MSLAEANSNRHLDYWNTNGTSVLLSYLKDASYDGDPRRSQRRGRRFDPD
jgi:hypothetical protein